MTTNVTQPAEPAQPEPSTFGPDVALIVISVAFTAAISMLVNPWLERRSRRRDRWSAKIQELNSLVTLELPSAADAFVLAAADVIDIEATVPSAHLQRSDRYLVAMARRKASEDALGSAIARLQQLSNSCTNVRRRAPFWKLLRQHVLMTEALRMCYGCTRAHTSRILNTNGSLFPRCECDDGA